jgi:rubredoxin
LLEALIATPNVKLDDLLLCDKSAIMMAARILGYGKEYKASFECPSCGKKIIQEINLEEFGDKECPFFNTEQRGLNEFVFKLPISKKSVVFKYLTHLDEKNIKLEIDGVKKAFKSDISSESTTRLRYSILAVDGETDRTKISEFINTMFARDASALREYIKNTMPDIDLDISLQCETCGYEGRAEMPIGLNFFWPNARI